MNENSLKLKPVEVVELQKYDDKRNLSSQETKKRMLKLRQGAVSRITEKVCNTEGEECEETDNSVVDATFNQLASV